MHGSVGMVPTRLLHAAAGDPHTGAAGRLRSPAHQRSTTPSSRSTAPGERA